MNKTIVKAGKKLFAGLTLFGLVSCVTVHRDYHHYSPPVRKSIALQNIENILNADCQESQVTRGGLYCRQKRCIQVRYLPRESWESSSSTTCNKYVHTVISESWDDLRAYCSYNFLKVSGKNCPDYSCMIHTNRCEALEEAIDCVKFPNSCGD